MRLVYAFNHDEDDSNDLDAEETLTALAVDWANDSLGDGDVDYEDFLDSVFELARTWAEDESEWVARVHSQFVNSIVQRFAMMCLTSACTHTAAINIKHMRPRAHALTRAQTETGSLMRTIWFYTCRTFSSASSVTTWALCSLGGTNTSSRASLRTVD